MRICFHTIAVDGETSSNIGAISDMNSLSANPTKWLNTLKQFVGNFPINCLSVFDHFVKLVLKELRDKKEKNNNNSYN